MPRTIAIPSIVVRPVVGSLEPVPAGSMFAYQQGHRAVHFVAPDDSLMPVADLVKAEQRRLKLHNRRYRNRRVANGKRRIGSEDRLTA